ncbi:MAG: alpha/beta hydrolase [Parvibaculum sp.]
MEHFLNGHVRIAYKVVGEGEPIVLVHGFASSHIVNWVEPGWVDTLVAAGRQVIMFDLRGHGESEKLFDEKDYDRTAMAGDIAALLTHLGHTSADVMGYSLGAMLTLRFARVHGDMCRRAILAGVGAHFLLPSGGGTEVVDALMADDPRASKNAVGRAFRSFADRNGQNRQALAICYGVPREPLDPEKLKEATCPILVVAGDRDEMAGDPAGLADLLPDGKAISIPKRDHMRTVGDPTYKKVVLEFLQRA